MRYVGSKRRLIGPLRTAVAPLALRGACYWEPFVGGMNAFEQVAPLFDRAVGVDLHQDLMLMWDAVLHHGWRPPHLVTEDEYQSYRFAEPSAKRGFVGFGCSYGGKWFGGYARGKDQRGRDRNFADESARSIARTAALLAGTDLTLRWGDCARCEPEAGDVVYCDPPYQGRLGYDFGEFDHERFWQWCESLADQGVHVLVSEYARRPGWREVWSGRRTQSVGEASARGNRVELLLTKV